MADKGNLTDTELLGLISKTAGGLQMQSDQESLAKEDHDSGTETTCRFIECYSNALQENKDVSSDGPEQIRHSDAETVGNLESTLSNIKSSPPCSKSQSNTGCLSLSVSNTDLTAPFQTETENNLNNESLLPTVTLSSITQSKLMSEIKDNLLVNRNIDSQTLSTFPCQVVTSADKISLPESGSDQTTDMSPMKLMTLVQEYKTELEATKKKLEKSERKLTKANDYNEVLRNMVEKLSGEIHSMKNLKTCSVHVQVDKDDFLDYITGKNTMPRWNEEGEGISMDTNESSIPTITSPEIHAQHPVSETDSISIADSIKQAAEAVVQQQQADMLQDRGYVYDEHSGLYYHSATGYYYDQHKSLFYDPKTGIYYYYDYDTGQYVFHSQVELTTQNQVLEESGHGKQDQSRKKSSSGKKNRKPPREKGENERHATAVKVFKNRKERRQAEKENQLRRKRKHRNDCHREQSESKRRYKDSVGRRHRSYERGQRSERSGHRGHRSGDRNDSRGKIKSRSRSERKHGKRKYEEEYIELQSVEGDKTNISKAEKRGKIAKHKNRSGFGANDINALSKSDNHTVQVDVHGDDSNRDTTDNFQSYDLTQNSEEENDLDSEKEFIIIDDADDVIDIDDEDIVGEDMDNETSELCRPSDPIIKTDSSKEPRSRKHSHHDSRPHHRGRGSEKSRNYSSQSDSSGDEAESGELTDSDIEQSYESYSSCYSSSDEEESYKDIDDYEDQDDQEEVAASYPPCVRVMVLESEYLPVGTLYIVTCAGAKIGRENCDICIPDVNISKVHAEIRYNDSSSQYEIWDHASQNGTFLNDQRLSPAKIASETFVLSHDDNVCLSSTRLLCHIHAGYDTCDQCEPGVVIATYRAQQPQTEIKVLSKEEKLRQKKQELNQIKKRYGLKNSAYEDNPEVFNNPNYTDKAEERRKFVGSDVPGQKQEAPASVHRPISTGNIGHKMLQKMGWKEGDSLGKDNKGIQEPISVTLRASQKAGLGSSSAGAFSVDDANTVDMKKANRRLQAQQRFNKIETKSDHTDSNKSWTQGETEFI